VKSDLGGLVTRRGGQVEHLTGAKRIRLPQKGGIRVELEVPDDVLEWHAAATDESDRELWRDWADYYAVAGESPSDLRGEMESDIERFVSRVLDADAIRVRGGEGGKGPATGDALEVSSAGRWETAWFPDAGAKLP
jgi:hypothetical protein